MIEPPYEPPYEWPSPDNEKQYPIREAYRFEVQRRQTLFDRFPSWLIFAAIALTALLVNSVCIGLLIKVAR